MLLLTNVFVEQQLKERSNQSSFSMLRLYITRLVGGHAKRLWMDGTRMRYGKGQHDTLFCRLAGNGYYATVGMHRG